DLPVEELLLELEAQDDVQVVGRLVRLDPDQRRLHLVDRAVERLCVDPAEPFGKRLLQLRVEAPPERAAAADEVLPHAALRLVDPERRAARERCARYRRRDLVLVEAVPELVHAGEDGVQIVEAVPSRDPDVRRADTRGERMTGFVEPPRVRYEAEGFE